MSRVLAKRALVSHPDFAHASIDIGAKVTLVGSDVLKLEYVVVGHIADLSVPSLTVPGRGDELWKHTCFEAFVALGERRGYVEYNFSPSRQSAVYRFVGYREGMAEALDLALPDIYVEADGCHLSLTARLDIAPLFVAGRTFLGLSAVIEELNGQKSYWALTHPPGKPDFHHPDCFALQLPAPKPL